MRMHECSPEAEPESMAQAGGQRESDLTRLLTSADTVMSASPAQAGNGSGSPFSRRRTRPIFLTWPSPPTIQRNPAKLSNPNLPNPRLLIRRRRGPTCSRSARRWRNCSIPRSTAAMPAWVPAPDCSRRRIIPGTAAPAARPPRIGRGHRRRAPAMMWQSGMRLSTIPLLLSLPPCGGGSGWGVTQALCPLLPPPPTPPRKGEGRNRGAGFPKKRTS